MTGPFYVVMRNLLLIVAHIMRQRLLQVMVQSANLGLRRPSAPTPPGAYAGPAMDEIAKRIAAALVHRPRGRLCPHDELQSLPEPANRPGQRRVT